MIDLRRALLPLLALLALPARAEVSVVAHSDRLGLEVRAHRSIDAAHAEVEFVARFRVAGRAVRQHERSRFVQDQGQWWYVDGDVL